MLARLIPTYSLSTAAFLDPRRFDVSSDGASMVAANGAAIGRGRIRSAMIETEITVATELHCATKKMLEMKDEPTILLNILQIECRHIILQNTRCYGVATATARSRN